MELQITVEEKPPKGIALTLQRAVNFREACKIASRMFKAEADRLRRESERPGDCDPGFWEDCASEAEEAGKVYEAALMDARIRTALALRARGLEPFARAIETGEYLRYIGM